MTNIDSQETDYSVYRWQETDYSVYRWP